jgi:hypothetical protein
MAVWAGESRDAAVSDIEIVTLLGTTVAGAGIYVALTRPEERRTSYRAEVLARARTVGVDGRPIFRGFAEDRWAAEYEESKAHKKTAILLDWIAETPTKEIEQRYEVWAGAIARIGEEYGWLAEALSDICRALNWPADETERIRMLAGRLAFGVEADALPIMRLRIPRLGRVTASRLRAAGLIDLEQARQAPPDVLRRVIGRQAVVDALWRRLHDDSTQAAADRSETSVQTAPTPNFGLGERDEAQAGTSPELLVDIPAGRVVFRGVEIPTAPPNHLQRQPLLYLAALAAHARTTMSDADLAAAVAEIGGRQKRPIAPDLKDLRYKIVRPFRLKLRDTPNAHAADGLIERFPGGLRLNVPGPVEVRSALKAS